MQTRIGALPAFTLLALCCQPAWAGGILLDEIGTDNVGLANAGAAARAQGPSTIWVQTRWWFTTRFSRSPLT
ncbi:hypothetical protein ABIA48_000105 [Pseudomonas sp. S30_BP2TU TE3576]